MIYNKVWLAITIINLDTFLGFVEEGMIILLVGKDDWRY